jgi:hypothetical protein
MLAHRQGLSVTQLSQANNPTELASMDPLDTIYLPYRFSLIENNKLWLFDIRTLLQEKKRLEGRPFLNPYTSLPLESKTLTRLQSHMEWLSRHKYSLDNLSEPSLMGPIYQQKIVELCFIIDSHGYLTNYLWFEILDPSLQRRFIQKLNDLWSEGLGLTNTQRLALFPSWTPGSQLVPAIRNASGTVMLNNLLIFLLEFVKGATEKELRALTTVHILTALTYVVGGVRRSFPWLFS